MSLQKEYIVQPRIYYLPQECHPPPGFPRTHKIDNIGIIANFVFPYLHFPSLFAPYDVGSYDIRYQRL